MNARTSATALALRLRVADDAAFADRLAARLELRLHQGDEPGARRCQAERRRQRLGQADETDIGDDGADRAADDLGIEAHCASVPSRTTTRGSSRSFACSWSRPTSTANTRSAPRASSTSVKPPVEAPISSAMRPLGSRPKASSAAASLRPPRETKGEACCVDHEARAGLDQRPRLQRRPAVHAHRAEADQVGGAGAGNGQTSVH